MKLSEVTLHSLVAHTSKERHENEHITRTEALCSETFLRQQLRRTTRKNCRYKLLFKICFLSVPSTAEYVIGYDFANKRTELHEAQMAENITTHRRSTAESRTSPVGRQ